MYPPTWFTDRLPRGQRDDSDPAGGAGYCSHMRDDSDPAGGAGYCSHMRGDSDPAGGAGYCSHMRDTSAVTKSPLFLHFTSEHPSGGPVSRVLSAHAQTQDDDRRIHMDHLEDNAVLSDVHLLRPSARHVMTRLDSVGQPLFRSRFRFLTGPAGTSGSRRDDGGDDGGDGGDDGGDEQPTGPTPTVDEDGDLEISRRPGQKPEHDVICPVILHQSEPGDDQDQDQDQDGDASSLDVLTIEHAMATPLEGVGKQVWRAAFLLADFILADPARFEGATVLELGAGTGVTSIVMATAAKTVYSTDVGADLLSTCSRNVALNRHLTAGEVRVRHLDWLQTDLQTDAALDFSWTQEDVEDMHAHTSVILAADVCYDHDSTDALFRTVSRLCSRFGRLCHVFVSIEKRMNFSLRRLRVACEAYDHFRCCVSRLQAERAFSVQRLQTDFPQALRYERVQQLELWKITADPSQAGP